MDENGGQKRLAITFDPLRETLRKKKLKLIHLRKPKEEGGLGLSSMTTTKISHDEPVSFEVLDTLCRELGCRVEEVIQYQDGTFRKAKARNLNRDRLAAAMKKPAMDGAVSDAQNGVETSTEAEEN